jgi:hypothetical protein
MQVNMKKPAAALGAGRLERLNGPAKAKPDAKTEECARM